MKNTLIDAAVTAYQNGNERAFTDLYRDWLRGYLMAFVNNACSPTIGMNPQDLESLAHAVVASACRARMPGRGACWKTWLCMMWRQALCGAIRRNCSQKAAACRLTYSPDQMIEADDGGFVSSVADPQAANPGEVLVALETLDARLRREEMTNSRRPRPRVGKCVHRLHTISRQR